MQWGKECEGHGNGPPGARGADTASGLNRRVYDIANVHCAMKMFEKSARNRALREGVTYGLLAPEKLLEHFENIWNGAPNVGHMSAA
jgi:hypothetical protein